MTQVFQIGDVVRVRNHTNEEKRRYAYGWSGFMDALETKQCIVVTVNQTGPGRIGYALVPIKSDRVVASGVSRGDVQVPDS